MSDRIEILREVETDHDTKVVVTRNKDGMISASEFDAGNRHIRECRANGLQFETVYPVDSDSYKYYEDHLGSAVVSQGKYSLYIYQDTIKNFKVNGLNVPKRTETILHTLTQAKMKLHANKTHRLTMFADTSLSLTKYLEEFNDL
jgi:hypothetical protein